MVKVVVIFVGYNKENFVGLVVIVGMVCWGYNGVDFGKEIEIVEGIYIVMVYSVGKFIYMQQVYVLCDGCYFIEIDIDN